MSAVMKSGFSRFREMRDSDIDRIIEIEQDAYDFPWSAAIFRDCLRVAYQCSVLLLDDQIVGFTIVSTAAGEAHLLNLCVDVEYRGAFHGSALLRHALGLAIKSGCRDIFLEVRPSNEAALRLYQRNGFRTIGTRPKYYRALGGREDAYVLTASLESANTSAVFVTPSADQNQFRH